MNPGRTSLNALNAQDSNGKGVFCALCAPVFKINKSGTSDMSSNDEDFPCQRGINILVL